MAAQLAVPRYRQRSLGEVIPSLLSSLGLAGFDNRLGLEPASRVCLLLIDGLGWELVKTNASIAPFLVSIAREPLTAGFPATTAASLATIATGVPPGEHGLTGYTMALPGHERAFNALTWALYGVGPRRELIEGSREQRMDAYRMVRDELVKRIRARFGAERGSDA